MSTKPEPTQDDADEILLDVWDQWSLATNNGGQWAGGLSTLEWVENYLKRRRRLDAKGNRVQSPSPSLEGEAKK